jgi:hypothetical protein
VGRRKAERRRRKGARRRCGLVVLVEKIRTGSHGELRWIVGVLIALRIEDGERWWRLPTVSRGCGGGPVSNGDRGRGNWMERKFANPRACAREAKGEARGPEEDVPVRKQGLAPRRRAWQPRRSSGRSSATWRTQGQSSTGSGGRRHGRGVTRGTLEGRR